MNTLGRGRPLRQVLSLLAGVTLGCFGLSAEASAVYQFTSIATTAFVGQLSGRPWLANDGTVMFTGSNVDGTNDRIFTGKGGPFLRTVVSEFGGPFDFILGVAGISENTGLIGFSAQPTNGQFGVFTIDENGFFTTIVQDGDSVPASSTGGHLELINCIGRCDIADDGRVTFVGEIDGGPLAIFTGSGGPVEPFVEPSPPLVLDPQHGIATNNVGQRAAVLDIEDGSLDQLLLVGQSDSHVNGQLISTSAPSNPFKRFERFAINDDGAIAVHALLDSGGSGIFVIGNDGTITPIADTSGPFSSFSQVAINDFGAVVFEATLDVTSASGIFTGPDPVLDRVIGAGDQLFDQTVGSVNLGIDGINNSGSVAFNAVLGDSTFVNTVARADLGPGLIGGPASRHFLDLFAQMSTMGGDVSMSQVIATSAEQFDLEFDLEFLTEFGEVSVMLGDFTVGVFDPSNSGSVFLPISLRELFGLGPDQALPEAFPLMFLLSGPPGAVARIDSVRLPGVANGEFELGYFDDWLVESDGGVAFVSAFDTPTAVAEPGVSGLLALGLALLGLTRGRGRRMRSPTELPRSTTDLSG